MIGFTPIRTTRLIASIVALLGMFVLLIERVLASVLQMAKDGVQMGLTRYDSFTGRMALQNFPEDKKLYGLLKDVGGILPTADTALSILLVLSIALLVVAVVGLAVPRQFAHVLVALKLLKWTESDSTSETEKNAIAFSTKKFIVLFVSFVVVTVVVVGARSCSNARKIEVAENAAQELQEQALTYIKAQKSYFAKKKVIGGPKALNLPDSLETKTFKYKVSGSKFTAVSKVQIAECPQGSRWSVSSSTKGFFTQELVLFRSAPKEAGCASVIPQFKSLGRDK